MPNEKNPIVVLVTTKDIAEAKKIADKLIKEKLAACVNIVEKVHSVYRWKGKICKESEALCIIKTVKRNFKALEKKIKSMHSYTVPEVIGLPIEIGSEKYLKWVLKETKTLL